MLPPYTDVLRSKTEATMRVIIGLILGLAVMMLALPVAAQDYKKGVEAYGRGDYATALREWRPLAEQGDAGAQATLGAMYEKGLGVAQDNAEAMKWYRKAAEQGYALAQNNLGAMYHNGLGVSQDYVNALMWFNLAVAQGNGIAAKNSEIVAEMMSRADISKAQRLAREWTVKHQK